MSSMSLLHKQVPNKHRKTMTAIHTYICVKKLKYNRNSTNQKKKLVQYRNHLNSVHLIGIRGVARKFSRGGPTGGKTFKGGGTKILKP